ncbi:trypsin-like serine protease [Mesorhizobium sp. VK4C]|uniref:trypsin-like serine peptidase n=1 Tax=Mesorhizobium captivum TaxID=3072319 RepID=UPI002A23F6EB|nr:trypsin-like serine protease [Mesorhizobium sp. VK4C]MDX8502059.1 trypsin-like serine protease [Mesorhizobium sp. VK4C]
MRRIALVFYILVAASSMAMAGTVGADKRLAIADYAKQHKIDEPAARKLFGASGRIMCPFNAASAFLVYKSDIVLSARHVVLPEPSMKSYAGASRPSRCAFELSSDGEKSTWYEVDVKTIIYPENKERSFTDRFDWIVMKLTKPIPDVTPYALTDTALAADDDVTMVTLRQDDFPHDGWNERIVEDCKIRKVIDIDAIAGSGLKLYCSAAPGASGGALVRQGPKGIEAVGIQSSITRSCKKFNARSCYSFAVGLSEDVRKAIRQLAGEP